jgi:predicted RNA methylase
MKLWQLEEQLQKVKLPPNPKIVLEQYATTPHLAYASIGEYLEVISRSQMIFNINSVYNDIADKIILDLGVGSGMLSIGAACLECKYVTTCLIVLFCSL